MGTRFLLGVMQCFGMYSGDDCTTLWTYKKKKTHWITYFKMNQMKISELRTTEFKMKKSHGMDSGWEWNDRLKKSVNLKGDE